MNVTLLLQWFNVCCPSQDHTAPIEDLAIRSGSGIQAELAEAKKNLEATIYEAKTGSPLPHAARRGTKDMCKQHACPHFHAQLYSF